jgi:hypothetical protein
MTTTIQDRAKLILQSIRELRQQDGPVHPFRIKRQLVNTRKFCKTIYPDKA